MEEAPSSHLSLSVLPSECSGRSHSSSGKSSNSASAPMKRLWAHSSAPSGFALTSFSSSRRMSPLYFCQPTSFANSFRAFLAPTACTRVNCAHERLSVMLACACSPWTSGVLSLRASSTRSPALTSLSASTCCLKCGTGLAMAGSRTSNRRVSWHPCSWR